MKTFFEAIEKFFSIEIANNLKLYNLLAIIFKYIFAFIIFYFIFNIIKMIYLDINTVESSDMDETDIYLKLINKKEDLNFKVKEYYPVYDDVTTIGRSNDSDIVLQDKYISKDHCRIVKDEGLYFLEDLESSNGTYLNGEEVLDAVELKNRDIILVGRVEFLFVKGD